MAEKTITISNWQAGMSDVDLDEYAGFGQGSYIQQMDIRESRPFLRPFFDSVDDSTGLTGTGRTGQIRGYATRFTGVGQPAIYAVDYGTAVGGGGVERIGVYQKTLFDDSTWAALDHDESAGILATEPKMGVEFFDTTNMFFASAESNDITIGTMSVGTDVINPTWEVLSSSAWGGSSGELKDLLLHTDDNLYFLKGGLNQGYLGPYDGTTLPDDVTPAATPSGLEPLQAISYGNKILVLAASTRGRSAKLLIRDPYQSLVYTFDDIYELSIYRPQVIKILNGRVIIITADYDFKIWEWLGGDQTRLLYTLPVGSYDTDFSIRKEAVDVKDNILYFGTTCGVSTFNNGVYAFGFNPDGSVFCHNTIIDQNDDVSDMQWRAIKFYDDGSDTGDNHKVGMVGTVYDVDASAYRNIENVTGSTRAGSAEWHSVWIRAFPGLRSQIISASLYHEDLGASDTITFASKVDATNAASYTTNFTASGNGSYKTVVGNNVVRRGTATLSNAFSSGHKVKIRITMTNGAQLEKIKLRVRTTERE